MKWRVGLEVYQHVSLYVWLSVSVRGGCTLSEALRIFVKLGLTARGRSDWQEFMRGTWRFFHRHVDDTFNVANISYHGSVHPPYR